MSRSRTLSLLCCALASVVLALAIPACSPGYDWRTVVSTEDGFSATFPGKPVLDERNVTVNGVTLHMRMHETQAGDAIFAVGVATLPDASPAGSTRALAALQDGLGRNFGRRASAQVAHIAAADGSAGVNGVQWTATGAAPGQAAAHSVRARFFVAGTRVYQIVVVSPGAVPAEQADQFFDSIRLN